jgi:hypothetical protein
LSKNIEISDEKNAANREAALKLYAELNAALGIEIPVGDPVVGAALRNRERFNPVAMAAMVKELHRIQAESVAATLHATVWRNWKARTWRAK